MSYKQKMEIMSNEATRRLTNIDHERLGTEEQVRILEQFTQELKNSGYTIEQAREIIISGFRGWSRRLARRRATGLYRSAKDSLEEREKAKLIERDSWFLHRKRGEDEEDIKEQRRIATGRRRLPKNRKSSDNKKKDTGMPSQIKAVMFVPYTIESKLAKDLRASENLLCQCTGAKLKI